MKPSSSRVASRFALLEIVRVFLDALRRPPTRRLAFIDVIPSGVEAFASGTFEFLVWRINAALHTPVVAGKVANRIVSAMRQDGPVRDVFEKIIEGEPIEDEDLERIVGVLENTTVDVLENITDVRSAAAALQMPVDDAIHLVLKPKIDAARDAVHSALGN